jgi:cell wall-associated NlpC family hydrolase
LATPRTPSSRTPRSRVTRLLAAIGLATAVASAAGAALAPTGALAEPRPSLAEVERRVAALDLEVEKAAEAYNAARIELQAAKRRTAVAKSKIRREQQALDAARRTMSAMLASAYRAGGSDEVISLVSSSDPQLFLDKASSLDRIARSQSDQMAGIELARHRLRNVEAAATREQKAQAAVEAELATQKRAVEKNLRTQNDLLAGLKADERRRYEAARAARVAAAASAARASRTRSVAPSATYNGPASGRAAVAVREAYNKLGSPYKWGAAGPDRFDCSGLTMWVWGKAGVSLPHNSRAQYSAGRKVSRSSLQPGDLVYYGSPIHHVGIYIGGGRMISAPQTGDVVKIQNAFRGDYAGATRP